MLKGLLTPAWQSESVEKRLGAVQKMSINDDAEQGILLDLIATDTEIDIRCAALNKLNKPELVWEISQSHEDNATCQHAKSVFIHLIGHKSNLTETEFNGLLKSHVELKLPIAAHCPFEKLRHTLIASLNESEQAELLG